MRASSSTTVVSLKCPDKAARSLESPINASSKKNSNLIKYIVVQEREATLVIRKQTE
jgi:hypothetical protein